MKGASRKRPTASPSAAGAAARDAGRAAASFARVASLAFWLALLTLAGVLFLDIPIYAFDRFAPADAVAPSQWIRLGDLFLVLSVYAVLLIARRYGAETATQAIVVAWGLTIACVAAELAYLAPTLEPGDLPSARFAIAFAASWIAGQVIAAQTFDLARTTDWWRAPLYGGLWGLGAQSAIFVIGQFWGLVPLWPNWLMTDLFLKVGAAALFLPVYSSLRKTVRPRPGYGGR